VKLKSLNKTCRGSQLADQQLSGEDVVSAPGMQKEKFMELQNILPALLPDFLTAQRWFGAKARAIRGTGVADVIPFGASESDAFVILARVEYDAGPQDVYVLPLVAVSASDQLFKDSIHTLRLKGRGGASLVLGDALRGEKFLLTLHSAIDGRRVFPGLNGAVRAEQASNYRNFSPAAAGSLKPVPMKVEQSNSSIVYGNRLVLKMFRHLEQGINPDLEIGFFLTEKVRFPHMPAVVGWLEYAGNDGRQSTLGILQQFVPNEGDAWAFTLKSLSNFWRQADQHLQELSSLKLPSLYSVKATDDAIPDVARKLCGPYLDSVALLGQRTAQLHLALASDSLNPAFAPEPYTPEFQKQFAQSLAEKTKNTLRLLRSRVEKLPNSLRPQADRVMSAQDTILQTFRTSLDHPISAVRTRIHGDYHLGQVLYTGSDFVIIDFEGEPARPMSERRRKLSPLQDVAGMLRSFHYAAFSAEPTTAAVADVNSENARQRSSAAEAWRAWVTARFLRAYLKEAGNAPFIPNSEDELQNLLRIHLLEKALYELNYELNNRPDWVRIPLAGVVNLLKE
jgi:trehalose synthase-fused probable maltokinase